MKKLTLIGLYIFLPFSALAEHDFAYYKAKTIEMLPVLNIDPKTVFFADVKKEPTLHMAITNPKTIFIPTSILNTKSTEEALFECAVQAQLSQVDFAKCTTFDFGTLINAAILAGAFTYSVPILVFNQSWTFNDWIRAREKNIATGILFGGLGLALFLTVRYWLPKAQKENAGGQVGKLFIYLAVINQLLTNEKTAPIAIAGMSLATKQYEQFAALAQHVSTAEREQLEKSYQTVNARVQQWFAGHPNTSTISA